MWDPGWDNIYQDDNWGNYPSEALIRFMARHYYNVEDRSHIRILDLGCGPGVNLAYLGREGFEVSGVDGSDVAIQKAKNFLRREKIPAHLKVSDVMHTGFEDDTFDCVLDIECMTSNSFKDSLDIVAEVHRILKPGGRFFSMTFSVGTYGDGRGEKLEGEENTYVKIDDGIFRQGYGIIRLTAEEEINKLYGKMFKIENIDYLIRSVNNRAHEVKEWLITGIKE